MPQIETGARSSLWSTPRFGRGTGSRRRGCPSGSADLLGALCRPPPGPDPRPPRPPLRRRTRREPSPSSRRGDRSGCGLCRMDKYGQGCMKTTLDIHDEPEKSPTSLRDCPPGCIETTLDIHDELLERAKRRAETTGRRCGPWSRRGWAAVLAAPPTPSCYKLPDRRVGGLRAEDPLEAPIWPERRDMIHEPPETAATRGPERRPGTPT